MDHCKLFLLFLLFLFTTINVVIASVPKLSPNTFLFCLKSELEPLEISLNRGGLSVGLPELDDFFQTHEVVRIEPWIKSATKIDRDGDIYLNRIYRVYIDGNSLGRTDQSISSIQDLPFILYAEPEYIRKPYYKPNDPSYSSQCSLEAVKANLAWDYWDIPNKMPGDKNILLASVDTGVDYTHPDLIENIWVNQGEIPEWIFEIDEIDSNQDGLLTAREISDFMETQSNLNDDGEINFRDAFYDGSPFVDGIDNDGNGYVDDLIGWDSSGEWGMSDNDPFPKTGVPNDSEWAHGTHVAGILAATTNNGLGMASTMFNGSIISVKASKDGPNEEPGIHDGYDGITYAAKAGYFAGARSIINCSWGGGGNNISEQSVINNAFTSYRAIIVAAAGNGDEDAHQEEYAVHYPASYENVESVCAMSCNGNWGNWATYHPTVDLAAPGNNIYSTIIGGGYQAWDGSSMASPNAASVLGLVWSYHPLWTNEDVVEQVKLAADPFIYERNPDYIDCNGNEGLYCLGSGMVDAHKAIGRGFSPNIQTGPFTFTEIIGDSDGLINPGETGYLTISLKNALGWADAENIQVVLISGNPEVTIHDGNALYGNIAAGDSLYNLDDTYKVAFSSNIELDNIDFQLLVSGTSTNYNYDQSLIYEKISVSLNQAGFPVSTAELRASPLVIDLDGDGDKEIIFGDNNGFVHIYNADGSEVEDDTFPYDTGNQIWGSAAAADMDRDGLLDFVITSKSKHLYIFDQNGLKTDYNANKYLMGTPAIGNLDEDADLEVVFGGYSSPSSSNQIFAVNHDGSDVDGFPLTIGEKTKAGVALADFNGNGLDDIVVGTDDSSIYLIYDDGSLADGFPYLVADAIQTAPSVLDIIDDKIIFVGTGAAFGIGQNNNLYAINSDGNLRFTVEANKDIRTSPSFLNHNGDQYIFFGADDSLIYAVDTNGNALSGWPLNAGAPISKSIVFSDLDCDGEAEIIAANEGLDIVVYNIDGTLHQGFPINGSSAFTSSAVVVDLDNDGNLEILSGTQNELSVIDIKSVGSDTSYWNMYRGNLRRTGYSGTSPIGGYIAQCPEQLNNFATHMPHGYILNPLYPNPFNPTTTISYSISSAENVLVEAYDIRGRLVESLVADFQYAGNYTVIWDASRYPSGIYFIRMVSNNITNTRKILLIK